MPDLKLATQESWETHPMSGHRELLAFDRTFTSNEFAKIKAGKIPQEMEDKWFVYFEDGWLYFHRSWTGDCIFQMNLIETDSTWQVVEAWVSRDKAQYHSQNAAEDLKLLTNVLQWSLEI